MKTIYFTIFIFSLSGCIILHYQLKNKKKQIFKLLQDICFLNERIISMQSKISKLKIKNDELKKSICSILYNPHEDNKRIIGKEKWSCIRNAIDCAYDQFTLRLKLRYPGLEDEDLLLCCLFKLGLNSSEISIRMNLSNNAIRTRKCRLKKVLKITGKNADFNAFLDEF